MNVDLTDKEVDLIDSAFDVFFENGAELCSYDFTHEEWLALARKLAS